MEKRILALKKKLYCNLRSTNIGRCTSKAPIDVRVAYSKRRLFEGASNVLLNIVEREICFFTPLKSQFLHVRGLPKNTAVKRCICNCTYFITRSFK